MNKKTVFMLQKRAMKRVFVFIAVEFVFFVRGRFG